MDGTESGVLDSSNGDHFIQDYNQIKTYKRYYSRVSLCGMDGIFLREARTSHQSPHCTNEGYNPRLHADILLSSIPCLIVALHVRLAVCSSSGLPLRGAPADCREVQAMRQTNR